MRHFCHIIIAGLLGVSMAWGADYRQRAVEEEIIYFVLPDRFANGNPANDTAYLQADRLTHGFDPTHKGFYHGGDLQGLREILDNRLYPR